MVNYRKFRLVVVLAVLVAVLVSCAPVPATTAPAAAPAATAAPAAAQPAASEKSVAMVLPGPIGDQGWNTKAYLALEEYKKDGIKTAYVDSVPDPDNEASLRSYGKQNYSLVVGHGFTFVDPVMKVAPEFPGTNFFVSAGLPPADAKLPANVSFMQYKSEEGFYLAGMLAAKMSKTGTIGYIGAMATPICLADLAAYKMGAREINPQIKVVSVWVGSFDDPAKGRDAGLAQVANGVDVMIHDADSTGGGALKAAVEKGILVIGSVDDQSAMGPDNFLSSVTIDVTNAIAQQLDLVAAGQFGGIWKPGMKEGIIGMAPFGPAVPQDVKDLITKRQQEIVAGTFKVESIYEEID